MLQSRTESYYCIYPNQLKEGMSSETVRNKQVLLKDYISSSLQESDMVVKDDATIKLQVPEGSNAVLVKNLYLACDPYVANRLRKVENPSDEIYASVTPGSALTGFGVAKVVDSGSPSFSKGDLVWGITNWEEYSLISKPGHLFKIQHSTPQVPLSNYTGLLGISGLTAYVGLNEICNPKKGERVFISSAFGNVGQVAGQLAKMMGCYVVGSAGTKEKVNLLKEKLGFDDAFNYREEPDLDAALKRHFPEGIDIYFENVGGKMLDAVLPNLRFHGRVAICGMISQYTLTQHQGITNLISLLYKRARMEGFVVFDHYDSHPRFLETILPYLREGKISYVEDKIEGLDNSPGALVEVFNGRSFGKVFIAVADQ